MASQRKPYVKLPGSGSKRSLFTRSAFSLFQGDDHLLQVERSRFEEEYKRFYYKDIRAVILRRTSNWLITSGVLTGVGLVVLLVCGLLAQSSTGSSQTGFWVSGGSISGGLWVIAIINLLFGPTCVCHLHTPVQQEELYSLKRLRKANKAIARIRASVEGVQGALSEENRNEIPRLQGTFNRVPISHAPLQSKADRNQKPLSPSAVKFWHILLIVALFSAAVIEILRVAGMRNNTVLEIFLALFQLCICVTSIMLIVRPRPGGSSTTGWIRLGFWFFWFVLKGAFMWFAIFQTSFEYGGKRNDLHTIMSKLPDSFYHCMVVAAVSFIIWAILEIFALLRPSKPLPAPVNLQPPPIPAPSDPENSPNQLH